MKSKFTATLMALFLACVVLPDMAFAASGKKNKSRSDFTSEERAKIFKWALAQCRKQYGPYIHHVEIQYIYRRYTCYIG